MSATFLRDTIHAPRATQFLAVHPDSLDRVQLQAFIDDVWGDLLARIGDPIHITEMSDERVIEVFGAVRYRITKDSGKIWIDYLRIGDDGVAGFSESIGEHAADLPLSRAERWMEHYLCHWQHRLGEVLTDRTAYDLWLSTAQRIFWNAVRRSTYWKRFRYAVRNALALDAEVLGWCRRGRSRHDNFFVKLLKYNRGLAHRDTYAQIARDNPNLVWLYTFMLDERFRCLPSNENAIAGMKSSLTSKGVTPAGWRMLAGGRERDFMHVRDWVSPKGELDARKSELINWLRFAPQLRLRQPLQGAVLSMLVHDNFERAPSGRICFRNVVIAPTTFNVILAEAQRRQVSGSLNSFINEDLVEVVTWLEAVKPVFDKNQLKAGWKCLTRLAVQWKVECEAQDTLTRLQWSSSLPSLAVWPWSVLPLTDAWQLREEALRQHHCVDHYIKDCLAGKRRFFSVRNARGHRVATIGIVRDGNRWRSLGIRGLANAPVQSTLVNLDEEVVGRYNDVWRLEEFTSAQCREIS